MRNKNKIIISIIVCLCILLLTLCYYEVYISYNDPQTKTYTLKYNKANIKAAVIADLHDNNLPYLSQQIKQQSPDIILVVGDMLNNTSTSSTKVTKLMKQLVKIAPVYYSLGNHEIDYIRNNTSNLLVELDDAGVTVLDEKYVDVTINNSKIRIGGMYDYAFGPGDTGDVADKEFMDPAVYNFLTEFQDTDNYKIMLAHRPDSFIFGDASEVWNIDLVVSGHDHGGQVRLPFSVGLYGGDQGWFPKYVDGMYKLNNINLFVTRGLGSHKQKLPRFNNRPEVSIIEIKNN